MSVWPSKSGYAAKRKALRQLVLSHAWLLHQTFNTQTYPVVGSKKWKDEWDDYVADQRYQYGVYNNDDMYDSDDSDCTNNDKYPTYITTALIVDFKKGPVNGIWFLIHDWKTNGNIHWKDLSSHIKKQQNLFVLHNILITGYDLCILKQRMDTTSYFSTTNRDICSLILKYCAIAQRTDASGFATLYDHTKSPSP